MYNMYHKITTLCVICLVLLSSCRAKKNTIIATPTNTTTQSSMSGAQQGAAKKLATAPVAKKKYTNVVEEYIVQFSEIAMQEMKQYGIPASITLAQGILESGSGKGRLAREANNHFGIKCHNWKGARIYHDDDRKQECFRKYNDPNQSYRDHSLFLVDRKRYADLFKHKATDYKAWAKGLKKAGYATDPKYPAKLIAQIQKYNLDQYDHPRKAQRIIKENSENPISSYVSGRIHQVQKGDTLFGISKKYGLSVDTLKKINGLKNNDIRVGTSLKISIK